MLILSRHIGEVLKIGDDVEVQVVSVNRTQVRLGIAAPKSVNVVRGELLNRYPAVAQRDTTPPEIRRELAVEKPRPEISYRRR